MSLTIAEAWRCCYRTGQDNKTLGSTISKQYCVKTLPHAKRQTRLIQSDLFAALQAVYHRSCLHISRRRTAGCFVYTRYSLNLPSRTYPYLFLEQSFFICHPILDKNKGFSLRDKIPCLESSLLMSLHVSFPGSSRD